jgi:hypothetical protein
MEIIACVTVAAAYTATLFWPALEASRFQLATIPVPTTFITVLEIGALFATTSSTGQA